MIKNFFTKYLHFKKEGFLVQELLFIIYFTQGDIIYEMSASSRNPVHPLVLQWQDLLYGKVVQRLILIGS